MDIKYEWAYSIACVSFGPAPHFFDGDNGLPAFDSLNHVEMIGG